MNAPVAVYTMNPAEDVILFGDELAEGMWVLPEDSILRHRGSEDEQLREQRFRRVTRLRRHGDITIFIGEWVDGYQRVQRFNVSWAWIVKKDSLPGEAEEATP